MFDKNKLFAQTILACIAVSRAIELDSPRTSFIESYRSSCCLFHLTLNTPLSTTAKTPSERLRA